MKVYIVMQGERCEGGALYGIFKSFKKALEFAKGKFPEFPFDSNTVDEKNKTVRSEEGCDWLYIASREVQ